RDTTASGTVFTGTPDIIDLSRGDFEVAIADGTALTVGGTVIDVNPAQEFNFVRLATTLRVVHFVVLGRVGILKSLPGLRLTNGKGPNPLIPV
ncbi:MAG: hypothetical protein AAF985_23240, partial [Bacteroidota bacterium]